MGRTIRRILLAALLCALAGFCLAHTAAPVWEARATLAFSDPAAPAALPGALTATGLSAYAIPGTDVVTLAASADAPEEAQARLASALAEIPRLLDYLSLSPEWETLVSATHSLSYPDPAGFALAGALLGALAAILWLLPPPNERKMLNLGDIIKGMGRLSARLWPLMLLTVCLFAEGNFLRARLFHTPQFEAQMLVRVGEYDPDTADGLSTAVLGLLDSQLADPGVDAQRVGRTNLFRLAAKAPTPEGALSRLQNTAESWPRLAGHIPTNPSLTVLEGPALSDASHSGASRAAILGGGAALGLWIAGLFLLAVPREKHVYANN